MFLPWTLSQRLFSFWTKNHKFQPQRTSKNKSTHLDLTKLKTKLFNYLIKVIDWFLSTKRGKRKARKVIKIVHRYFDQTSKVEILIQKTLLCKKWTSSNAYNKQQRDECLSQILVSVRCWRFWRLKPIIEIIQDFFFEKKWKG